MSEETEAASMKVMADEARNLLREMVDKRFDRVDKAAMRETMKRDVRTFLLSGDQDLLFANICKAMTFAYSEVGFVDACMTHQAQPIMKGSRLHSSGMAVIGAAYIALLIADDEEAKAQSKVKTETEQQASAG